MAFGPGEYWHIAPSSRGERLAQAQTVQRGIAAGAELELRRREQQSREALAKRNLDLENERNAIQTYKYIDDLEMQTNVLDSERKLTGITKGITDWSDPKQIQPIYELGIQSPWLYRSDGFKAAMLMHKQASDIKAMADRNQALINSREYLGQQNILSRELMADQRNELGYQRLFSQEQRDADRLELGREALSERTTHNISMEQIQKHAQTLRAARMETDLELAKNRVFISEQNMIAAQARAQAMQQLAAIKSQYWAPEKREAYRAEQKALTEKYLSGGFAPKGSKTLLTPEQRIEEGKNFDSARDALNNRFGLSLDGATAGALKKLDPATAKKFLDEAGGDKEKARKAARDAGYDF